MYMLQTKKNTDFFSWKLLHDIFFYFSPFSKIFPVFHSRFFVEFSRINTKSCGTKNNYTILVEFKKNYGLCLISILLCTPSLISLRNFPTKKIRVNWLFSLEIINTETINFGYFSLRFCNILHAVLNEDQITYNRLVHKRGGEGEDKKRIYNIK